MNTVPARILLNDYVVGATLKAQETYLIAESLVELDCQKWIDATTIKTTNIISCYIIYIFLIIKQIMLIIKHINKMYNNILLHKNKIKAYITS